NRMPAWKMSSLNSRRGTETYDQIYPGSGDAFCDQFYESAQRLKKHCLRTACGGHRPVHPAERRVDAFHNHTGGGEESLAGIILLMSLAAVLGLTLLAVNWS